MSELGNGYMNCSLDSFRDFAQIAQDNVEVDVCLTCHGVWLDASELEDLKAKEDFEGDQMINNTLNRLSDNET